MAAEFNNDPSNDGPITDECVGHYSGTRKFNFSEITVSKIVSILQRLKASKATGIDKIPAKRCLRI